jgi:selenocysteine-specific elongation factor
MKAQPPGQLQSRDDASIVTMLCTAGHVDHGKTSLVKTLTGCATDRLQEEIERGLTIELGFAPCWLGGSIAAGIVDVPGHSRFVRTMVAGVSGLDYCILVIAADDGIMPQTVEHIDIMQLMGMSRGMVALTKIDLVTPDIVEFRTQEIQEYLQNTFLRDAPICPLSTVTFDGFGHFYDTLVSGIKAGLRDRRSGWFRMPIERVFTRPGFGSVLSGMPVSGSIRVGDEVECIPGGHRSRIRGLQCFGQESSESGAGQCLALNVPEFGKEPPERGQVLCKPGTLRSVQQLHVRIQAVAHLDPPQKNASEVSIHTGTAERQGHLFLLETNQLQAGESQLATLVAKEPLAAAPGDRFIIRRMSPSMTIGGGRILAVEESPNRLRRKDALALLQAFERMMGDADWDSDAGRQRRMAYALLHGTVPAVSLDVLSHAVMLTSETIDSLIKPMLQGGDVVQLDATLFTHKQRIADAAKAMADRLEQLTTGGNRLRVPLVEWRQNLGIHPAIWRYCQQQMQKNGDVRVEDGVAMRAVGIAQLPDRERRLALAMLELYASEGFATTHPDEVHQKLGAGPEMTERVLAFLCSQGDLIRISRSVVLAPAMYRAAEDFMVETALRDGTVDSPAFRDHLGVSRKYAMAILDYMDTKKLTTRSGNARRLLSGWENRR